MEVVDPFTLGAPLSAPVAAAIPELTHRVRDLLVCWAPGGPVHDYHAMTTLIDRAFATRETADPGPDPGGPDLLSGGADAA